MQYERAHCRAGLPWQQEIPSSAADSGRAGGARSNQSRDMRERDRSEKRNPAKAGIKFVHFGGILQTAGIGGDRGAV